MKKIIRYLPVLLILVLACHPKTAPVITERKAAPPVRISSNYPPVASVPADTVAGRQLFRASCGRCHDLPEVQLYAAEKWEGILPTMFPRTRLSSEQAFHVRAYLLANARK